MSHDEIEKHHSDETLDAAVYGALLFLTALTLGASFLGRGGRIMAVSIALIIASMKASLIGLYYMNLRRERGIVYLILAIGALAVTVLLVGMIPDLTFARL